MLGGGSSEVPWRNVTIFIVLALGLGLGPPLLVAHGADQLLNIVPYFSPLLAALLVRKVVAREGFTDAHLGIRGVKAKYWFLAVFLPVAWNAGGALLDVVTGTCELHPDAILSGLSRWPTKVPVLALLLVGEELGWRSYLVEKLRPAGAFTAFGVCGAVWFTWHPQFWSGQSATVLHGLDSFIGVMCLSFIFGWLYLVSKSVWPCLVMHVFNNTGAPGSFKGGATCMADRPFLSDVTIPLILTVIVLWSLGAFARPRPPPPTDRLEHELRLG